MKKPVVVLSAAAGIASSASAAGTVVVNLVPQSTFIHQGESVTYDIFVDYTGVTDGLAVAYWKFDITHNPNGTATGAVNSAVFLYGVQNGADNGAGSLIGFAGGQLPSYYGGGDPTQFIGSINYTEGGSATASYLVSLNLMNYVQPEGELNVFVNSLGGVSRASLTDDTERFHLVVVNSGVVNVIIPSPASVAFLGLGGLVAGRRRR
jgi:hypothetical protein